MMLCLNIRTTYGMLGMHTQQGKLDIRQPAAEMSRDYQAPRSGIWPGGVEIDIDQYPCRRAYGYATSGDSLKEYRDKGLSGVIQGVQRRAREGDEVMENFGKYNVLREQARRTLFERDENPLVFKMIPEPEITVRQKPMKGSIDTGSDRMNIRRGQLREEYTPTGVEGYLKQKPELRMWTTEGKYDIYA